MKYVVIGGLAVALLVLVYLMQLNNAPTGNNTAEEQNKTALNNENKTATDEPLVLGEYAIVPTESEVGWTAEKPQIVGYTHYGQFPIQRGTINIIAEDTVTGTITLDMTNLRVESLGGGKAGSESSLEGHLKTGDFFEVETYPTATFIISESIKVEDGAYTVHGDLTIKDQTHPVMIPLTVTPVDGGIALRGETEIDRTKWGITFGSSNFFENLAENAINDIVKITLDIVAKK